MAETKVFEGINDRQLREAAMRAMRRCDELAEYSEDSAALTRTFCSDAMRQACQQVATWMRSAGMRTRMDPACNLIGRYATADVPGRKTLLVGSHLDSVINAGKYDGVLGVILGLALIELLNVNGIDLPLAVDVIGFSDEEGVRYQTPFIGSRSLVGTLEPQLLNRRDRNGVFMRDAIDGFGGNASTINSAVYKPGELIGFLEPHIEQGPILDRESIPLGVVTSIAGQRRAAISVYGQAGHAGTVPMNERHDALVTMACFIERVERIGMSTPGLMATVGRIDIVPNVANVIPGQANVQLDVRHGEDHACAAAFREIVRAGEEIARERGQLFEVKDVEVQPAVQTSSSLTSMLSSVVADSGIAVREMVSGAGHDAVHLSRLAPTALLFIRCRNGISHHPDESVEVDDVAVALKVMLAFVSRVAKLHEG